MGKPLAFSNLTPQETINAMVEADAEDGDGDEEEADADYVTSLKAATLETFSGVGCGWIYV